MHEILVDIRSSAGLTQAKVAKDLGLARQTYLDMENGKVSPRQDRIVQLSEYFNVPILFWFGEKAKRPPISLFTDAELMNEINYRMANLRAQQKSHAKQAA